MTSNKGSTNHTKNDYYINAYDNDNTSMWCNYYLAEECCCEVLAAINGLLRVIRDVTCVV